MPGLQYERGVVGFFRSHRGHDFASSALMEPITKNFVASIHDFVRREDIPLVAFRKGQRKDDIAQRHLAGFDRDEGVVFVGRAQEKRRRRNGGVPHAEAAQPDTGKTYAWIVRDTGMVNHFYFYCVDTDFGPFFLKLCSCFPYNAKLCLNGHHWAQRQAAKAGIGFTALDNGFAACEDPAGLQAICDRLDAVAIEDLARKRLGILPHPFTPADRQAGCRYDLSVLQAELSLTQMSDRPLSGRLLFEQVIRDNLDAGRPDQVSLTFARRVTKRTPGRMRTRVITDGVVPSLHVDCKSSPYKCVLQRKPRAAD